MKPSSCKAKGRNLQNYTVAREQCRFPDINPTNWKPAIMGESGIDIRRYAEAFTALPFSTECKNVEKLNLWQAWQQAKVNTIPGTYTQLIIKRNYQDPLVIFDFNTWLFDIYQPIQKLAGDR